MGHNTPHHDAPLDLRASPRACSPLCETRIRLKHRGIRTEQAYVRWINRFIRFDGKRHPATLGRMSLGILLCSRAETEQVAGIPNAARAAFSAADVIAAEVSAGADSELGLALARVRNLLAREQRSGADGPIAG